MAVVEYWSGYFEEIVRLLSNGERQYGIANHDYTDYMLQRLEFCYTTCLEILDLVQHHRNENQELVELDEYLTSLHQLLDCVRKLHHKWDDYQDVLDSTMQNVGELAYRASTSASGVGRPPFQIQKEQLEYLSSLGFSWTEIATLLGVSRMTIYRYVKLLG